MSEIIKTSEQIEEIFREAVVIALKLNPKSKEVHKRIRFPWGSNLMHSDNSSAPSWKKDEDVCFIYSLPQDDSYNRQRGRRYIDPGGRDLLAVDEHTDVHYFNFVNYGPNAYECARDIRNKLFSDEIRRLLKQNDFSLIPDVPAVKRVPELIQGEWWNRVDVSAMFNEYVRRESPMTVIEEVPFAVLAASSTGEDISRRANVVHPLIRRRPVRGQRKKK